MESNPSRCPRQGGRNQHLEGARGHGRGVRGKREDLRDWGGGLWDVQLGSPTRGISILAMMQESRESELMEGVGVTHSVWSL